MKPPSATALSLPCRRLDVVPDVALPPGWPAEVRPPGAEDWEQTAVTWLLDQCPHEYRAYGSLVHHPVALAWLAARHVLAQGQANAAARGAVRADLSKVLDARAVDGVLAALEHEHARLLAVHRAVGLVGDALRGLRYVPRL